MSVSVGQITTVRPGDILVQAIDFDAYLAGVAGDASTRGYFVNQVAMHLRTTRPQAYPALRRLYPDRFPMFRDVSMREALRFGFDVARLSHPHLPRAEALRRMGWAGYKNVLDSLLGKMLFASVGKDLEVIYRLGPRAYAHCETNGSGIAYTRLGKTSFRYDFDPCLSWLDSYQIGIVEGVAALCGHSTEITVDLADPYRGSLECRWF